MVEPALKPSQQELSSSFNPYAVLSLHTVYTEALFPDSHSHCFPFFSVLSVPSLGILMLTVPIITHILCVSAENSREVASMTPCNIFTEDRSSKCEKEKKSITRGKKEMRKTLGNI